MKKRSEKPYGSKSATPVPSKGKIAEAIDDSGEFENIRFRQTAAATLPNEIGVYALCDLDAVPLYVGLSEDGIRTRVRRHITSARSDIIANRHVDVWEIAFVRCWIVTSKSHLVPLESVLFHRFHRSSRLMNGTVPIPVSALDFDEPEPRDIQLVSSEEIAIRRRPEVRLPRQAAHFAGLLDQYLVVKNSGLLMNALTAHFERLERYFNSLRHRHVSVDSDD